MAGDLPPLILQVELDIQKLKTEMEQVTKTIDSLGKNAKDAGKPVNELGKHFKHLAEGLLAMEAIKKVGEFLGESAHAATENTKSLALMTRQLQSTTGASTEQIDVVDKQIEAMSRLDGVAAKEIRPSFVALARATGDTTQALRLQKIALDVAAGTGKNLQTVSLAMSRALTGNTGALNRLVPGAKNAKDQIGFLEKSFKGAAETAANADPYQRMNVAFEQIKESVGQGLIPVIGQFSDYVTSMVPQIQEFFSQLSDPTTAIGAQWKQFTDGLIASFNWVVQNARQLAAWAIAIGTVVTAVKLAVGAWELYKTAVEIAKAAQIAFDIAADANPVGLMITAVAALGLGVAALTGTLTAGGDALDSYTAKATALYNQEHPGLTSAGSGAESRFGSAGVGVSAADKIHQMALGMQAADARAAGMDAADKAAYDKRLAKWQAHQDNLKAAAKAAAEAAKTKTAADHQAALKAAEEFNKQITKLGTAVPPLITQSVGKAMSAVTSMIDGFKQQLAKGLDAGVITAASSNLLSAYANREKAVLDKIAAARDNLAQKYDLAKTLMGTISDSVKSMIDLSSIGTTATTVIASFDAITQKVLAFGRNLTQLKSQGLSKDLIAQIANAGVDAGSGIAAGLAAATPEQVDALNQSYKAISDASSVVSEQAARAVYGDGVDVGKGLLQGIVAQDAPLMKAAETMGERFSKAFAKAAKLATQKGITASEFARQMKTYEATAMPSALTSLVGAANKPFVGSTSTAPVINVTANATTNASPNSIAQSVVNSIKFNLPAMIGHM
jgi:ABC-type transporter lipoprotein component MlaA